MSSHCNEFAERIKPTRLFCRSRLRKFATNHYQIATKNVLTIIVRTQTTESSVIHLCDHDRLRSWKNEHPSEFPYSDTHNSHETSTVDATFLDTMREQCMQYATAESVQLQNPDLLNDGWDWSALDVDVYLNVLKVAQTRTTAI